MENQIKSSKYLSELNELLETLNCEYEIEGYNKCLSWTLKFGKHKGESFATVFACYPQYVVWAISKNMFPEHVVNCFKIRTRIKSTEDMIAYNLRDDHH